jgi:ABC-type multidrug transport system fused ATPase/permease subunit
LLTACQAIICITDLSALTLLVVAAGTILQPSPLLANLNITPIPFFSVLLIIFVVKNYFAFIIQQYQFRLVYSISARLSKQGIDEFLSGPFENYTDIDSSVWVRRISQQPIEFAQYILTGLQTIFTESLLVAGATVLLLLYNASLFLLLLSVLLPALLAVLYFTRKRLKHVRTSIKKNSELNLQYLQESLHGYIESNLFEKRVFFSERYGKQQQQLNHHLAQLQSSNLLPSRIMETFAVAGFCLLAIFWFSGVTTAAFPIMTIGAFLAGAYKLIPGMVKIINARNSIKTFAFAVQNLANRSLKKEQPPVHSSTLHSISFRHVYFQIADLPILEDVNFQLTAGTLTGMTAPSGKGKTTLINLLLGFREISSGQIIFNDVTADALERKKYWNRISYVKQQPFVLNDSLEQNITLETSTTAGIDEVTRITRVHDWLQQDVAQISINESGKNISGGQQQRIALARALHKDADCYILDEPFHALDTKATDQMMDHLEELASSGKMILLISHDPLTLQRCQKIIRLS